MIVNIYNVIFKRKLSLVSLTVLASFLCVPSLWAMYEDTQDYVQKSGHIRYNPKLSISWVAHQPLMQGDWENNLRTISSCIDTQATTTGLFPEPPMEEENKTFSNFVDFYGSSESSDVLIRSSDFATLQQTPTPSSNWYALENVEPLDITTLPHQEDLINSLEQYLQGAF